MPEQCAAAVGPEVSVHLAEQFTPLEARVLHDVASRGSPGTQLHVDFHDVRMCHDVALLLLAQDIRAGLAQYTLCGLSGHHLRLLGYLGAKGPGDRTGDAGGPADPSFG
jgi:hypothetical protein